MLPLLCLALLEFILRLVHAGYPTTYFLRTVVHGRQVIQENDRFGWLFFPAAIARTPTPFLFPFEKASNTFRVLVFGESAALGDPRPGIGPWRFLEALLEERFPAMNAEVIPVAMTAINSHVLYLMAKECPPLKADAWIVYAGNNEFIGPYGASGVFGSRAPGVWRVRLELMLRRLHLVQLLRLALEKTVTRQHISWTGIEQFQHSVIPPDDPVRVRVRTNFTRNLFDIVQIAVEHQTPVILSSMAVNLRDCGPFISVGTNRLDRTLMEAWNTTMHEARNAIMQTNWTAAASFLEQAIRIAPHHAGTHYQLAWCLRAQRKLEQAYREYEQARDLDALPVRATSSLQDIIREVAARFNSNYVRYVDVETFLREAVPDRVPGDEFFYEHVHLKPQGSYRIALAWAEALLPFIPPSFQQGARPQWPDYERCCQRLGLSPWNLMVIYEQMIDRISDEPYNRRIHHRASLEALVRALQNLQKNQSVDLIDETDRRYEEALAAHGDDPWLIQNYAEFLELCGRTERAITLWRRLLELWPHHFAPKFYLGRALGKVGTFYEAEQLLRQVTEMQPNFGPAWLELASIAIQQRHYQQAEQLLRKALALMPDSSRVRLLLADVLAAQDRRDEAQALLEELVRRKPYHWKAHYLLGVELALQNKIEEAAQHFAAAARLRPDSVLAHENLGVALARLGRFDQARTAFERALALDPSNTNVAEMLRRLDTMLEQIQTHPKKAEESVGPEPEQSSK